MSARGVYVVEATAYDSGIAGTRTLRFATRGFATKASDTPANTPIDDRLAQPAMLARDAFDFRSVRGRSRVGYGDATLLNSDGALDSILDYAFDGWPITIRFGPRGGAYPADFEEVLVGTQLPPEATEDEIRLKVRDRQAELDIPLQATKYAGDNVLPDGLEGVEADLQGKPKPVLLGSAKNFSPPCVNTTKLIYQVNDGAVADISVVRDRGVELFNYAAAEGFRWLGTSQSAPIISSDLNHVAYSAALDVFAFVMANGKILTSSDNGATLVLRSVPFPYAPPSVALHSVTFGRAEFVAVGYYNASPHRGIYTSPDGQVWSAVADSGFASGDTLYDVAYSPTLGTNGRYCVVGTSSKIATSDDLVTWTQRTSGFTGSIVGVTWSARLSLFVAVGANGELATSPDGITWTMRTSSFGTSMIRKVRDSADLSLLLAVGDSGKVATSPDGITWTQRTSTFGASNVYCVAYDPNMRMFVIGGHSGKTAWSRDGTNWTAVSTSVGGLQIRGLAVGSTRVLACTERGSNAYTLLSRPAIIEYATEADLLDDAQAPPRGTFGVYLAGGYFRLGWPPDGEVTCDATQGANAAARTAGQVWKALLERAGMTAGDWSASDITTLDGLNNAVVGHWWGSETQLSDALDAAARTVGAWWGADRKGVLRIMRLPDPSTGSSARTVKGPDMKRALRIVSAADGSGIPCQRTIVRYAENHTPQTDLAAAVSQSTRAELSKQWREVSAADASVATAHPLAPQIVVESLFAVGSDAQTEATRMQALLGSGRRFYEYTEELTTDTAQTDLGTILTIEFPRYGLAAGKKMVVLGVAPNGAADEVRITVWG